MADKELQDAMAKAYFSMIQTVNETITLTIGPDKDIVDILTGLERACLSHLRKAHDIVQAVKPEDQRERFSEFLKRASETYAKIEVEGVVVNHEGGTIEGT